MEPVFDLPKPVTEIEHCWIPTRDGTRLAARLWLPEGATDDPVPAILEYIPYRKRDLTRPRDSTHHPYFAGHGYACVRVDLRGAGDSEGVLHDEYLATELDDGEDVLEWLAEQSWCTGDVGMIGISWGGFNGLQLAARQPAPLKCVVAASTTDDRYRDDVHYKGGCLLSDNLSWASVMFAYNAMPPDPAIVGDQWRSMWHQRLQESGLWLERWLQHPHRDAYWRSGSICEDYAAITVPVFAVSGWADGYSDPVFRLVQNLRAPAKGLIGPWSHRYPHLATTGPAIGFLQECLRWFDRWLKAEATGVEDDPPLTVWMQEPVAPSPEYHARPGRWVSEDRWPSPNITSHTLRFARGSLLWADAPAGSNDPLTFQSPLSVGLFAGKWCSYGVAPDLPYDQREEDGGSLVFDTEPLSEPVELFGAPVARLRVSVDRPVAQVAVRLSDLATDDKATRVTYGLLNLTHRHSHAEPEPVTPGEPIDVDIPLDRIAQYFPPGHRIRLAISTSYWPLAWPPPEPARLTVDLAASTLTLPLRAPRADDGPIQAFPDPEGAPPLRKTMLEAGQQNWSIHRDLAEEETELAVINDEGRWRIEDHGMEVSKRAWEWYRYRGFDFSSVSGETLHRRTLARGDWSVETVTRMHQTCDTDHFHVHATVDAYEHGRRVYAGTWNRSIPRRLL